MRRQHVTRGSERIALSPLSYELLLALVHAAPNLVSLDELMKRVWPGVVVSPETVSQRVKLVRQALGDDATSPRYVAGVRGRGYRLVATVQALHGSGGTSGIAAAAAVTAFVAAPAVENRAPTEAPASPSISKRGAVQRVLMAIAVAVLVAALYGTGHERLREWWSAGSPVTATAAESSLAVLPFVNLSGDPASEHFSDGLSEEILTRLSRFAGLRVLARTSSFAYEDSNLDARELQDLLGVRYLLEGSVRREGNHLRVTAQLIGPSGFRIWSASYDRRITGILAIQDEIAASVVTSILPRLPGIKQAALKLAGRAYAPAGDQHGGRARLI